METLNLHVRYDKFSNTKRKYRTILRLETPANNIHAGYFPCGVVGRQTMESQEENYQMGGGEKKENDQEQQ